MNELTKGLTNLRSLRVAVRDLTLEQAESSLLKLQAAVEEKRAQAAEIEQAEQERRARIAKYKELIKQEGITAEELTAIIGIASSLGKMVNFNENDVRPMGRTASGVRGMNIDGGIAVGMVTSLEGEYILAITDRGYGKMTHYKDYRMTSRGTKGVITIHATEKVGNLVTIRAVNGNEDLMVITKAGIIIRIPLEQVKIAGRNTQGVKIIRLDDDQRVSSVAVVEHQEQEEIVEEENNK